jgi:hypothetical protein
MTLSSPAINYHTNTNTIVNIDIWLPCLIFTDTILTDIDIYHHSILVILWHN